MKDQLDRIEKELIEQEHRPIKLISNFIDRKEKWPDDESKQRSAKKALIWRFFFSPAVIAVAGGGIALLTFAALVWQNIIMKEQNEFLRQQLAAGDIAKYENIFLSNNETPTRRQYAVVNYLRLMRTIKNDGGAIPLNGANLSGCVFKNYSSEFINVDFQETIVDSLVFVDSDLSMSSFGRVKKKDHLSPWGFAGCDLSNTVLDFEINDLPHLVIYNSDMSGAETSDILEVPNANRVSWSMIFNNEGFNYEPEAVQNEHVEDMDFRIPSTVFISKEEVNSFMAKLDSIRNLKFEEFVYQFENLPKTKSESEEMTNTAVMDSLSNPIQYLEETMSKLKFQLDIINSSRIEESSW